MSQLNRKNKTDMIGKKYIIGNDTLPIINYDNENFVFPNEIEIRINQLHKFKRYKE